MPQPNIDMQLRNREVEIKFSAFEEESLQTVLETIEALTFKSVPLRDWLVPYGDPAKSVLYRYGIQLPDNVDAQQFTTWLGEELPRIQVDDQTTVTVTHDAKYDRVSK